MEEENGDFRTLEVLFLAIRKEGQLGVMDTRSGTIHKTIYIGLQFVVAM